MNNHYQDDSDSQVYQDSSQNIYSNSQDRVRSPLQRLVSLNVRFFNGLGFNVSANNFRQSPELSDESQQVDGYYSQSQGQIDYGDGQYESSPAIQVNLDQSHNIEYQSNQNSSGYEEQMSDQPYSDQSNSQSPFFMELHREEEGMSRAQINNLPTMQWSNTHNIFNQGQKCPVCLEEFKVGNMLRVMECLHRYHMECLDQWLTLKASCPSCRNLPFRQQGHA